MNLQMSYGYILRARTLFMYAHQLTGEIGQSQFDGQVTICYQDMNSQCLGGLCIFRPGSQLCIMDSRGL